jgi:uncharacterized membrane protein
MENFNKVWRSFFAVGLICIAIQQLEVGDFRPVMLPASPSWLHQHIILWAFSLLLIAACFAILFDLKGRSVSLNMAAVFFLLLITIHIPFYAKISPQMLGAWGDAFKILAFCGGAIIVAGTFPGPPSTTSVSVIMRFLGKLFLCTTLIVFGAEHFVYSQFVATIIPNYIPLHYFWTYFAGVALILSGSIIIIDGILRFFHINTGLLKITAGLLGLMIFLWVFMLHVPRAIADPHTGNGNEWTSVFEAFAFSGVAFILAGEKPK